VSVRLTSAARERAIAQRRSSLRIFIRSSRDAGF
jgi:hypothetical protein